MVKHIHISLEDKKFERYEKLKDRHSKTWEELLDVAFMLESKR